MDRRGFLKSVLAAGVAPAFVGSSVLMPVRLLWTPSHTFLQSGITGQYVVLINRGETWVLKGNKMECLTDLPGDVRPLRFNETAQLVYDGSAWRELWRSEQALA